MSKSKTVTTHEFSVEDFNYLILHNCQKLATYVNIPANITHTINTKIEYTIENKTGSGSLYSPKVAYVRIIITKTPKDQKC